MKLFDVSIESSGCSRDDLSNLRYFETTHVVTTLPSQTGATTSDQIISQFDDFLESELERVREVGLSTFAALGLRGAPPKRVHGELWPRYTALLQLPMVVAVGGIGINEGTKREWEFFDQQIKLAESAKLPIIVSTPTHLPTTHTYSMMARISASQFEPQQCLIQARDFTVLEAVLTEGFNAALRVETGCIRPEEVVNVCETYPDHLSQVCLTSGLRKDAGDVLALPKTIAGLQERAVPLDILEKIAFRNAYNFFKIDDTTAIE